MKKFLSLVLALIMAMSLVTISAGATEYKDFTDKDEIQYEEAVAVLNRLGIITGYGEGDFRPEGELTRGAAAKIIVSLLIGPEAAGNLVISQAPYSDVPVDHTFAAVISYCKTAGIISGYGDGSFKPGAPLTGYAFSKMLMGALGYKANLEGFVGSGWTMQVAAKAASAGLFDRISFKGNEAVTREQACQLALNTLKATMVEYSGGFTVSAGDATVNGAQDRNYKVSNQEYASHINNKKAGGVGGNIPVSGNALYTVEFGEEHFVDLRLDHDGNDLDAFGRPSNVWSYKKVTIGTFPLAPDFTFTTQVINHKGVNVTPAKIERELGLSNYDYKSDNKENGTIYVNGKDMGDLTDVAQIADWTDNGTLVEVYVDEDDADWIRYVVVIQSQLMEVDRIGSDYVALDRVEADGNHDGFNAENIDKNVNNIEEDDAAYAVVKDLKVEDKVVIIPVAEDHDSNSYNVARAYVPETVKGSLTGIERFSDTTEAGSDTVKVTVGGTVYPVSNWNKDLIGITRDSMKITYKDVTLTLDEYGNALQAEDVGETSDFMIVGHYSRGLVNGREVTYVDGWDISGNAVSLNIGNSASLAATDAEDKYKPGDLVRYTNDTSSNTAEWKLEELGIYELNQGTYPGTETDKAVRASDQYIKLKDYCTATDATAFAMEGTKPAGAAYADKGIKFIYVSFNEDDEVESIEVVKGMQNVTFGEVRSYWNASSNQVSVLGSAYYTFDNDPGTTAGYNAAQAAVKVKDDGTIDNSCGIKAVVIKSDSSSAGSRNILYIRNQTNTSVKDEDGKVLNGYTVAMMGDDGTRNVETVIYSHDKLTAGDFARWSKVDDADRDDIYKLHQIDVDKLSTSSVRAYVNGRDNIYGVNKTWLKLNQQADAYGSARADYYGWGRASVAPNIASANAAGSAQSGDEADAVYTGNAFWVDMADKGSIKSGEDLQKNMKALDKGGKDWGSVRVAMVFNDSTTNDNFRSVAMIVVENDYELTRVAKDMVDVTIAAMPAGKTLTIGDVTVDNAGTKTVSIEKGQSITGTLSSPDNGWKAALTNGSKGISATVDGTSVTISASAAATAGETVTFTDDPATMTAITVDNSANAVAQIFNDKGRPVDLATDGIAVEVPEGTDEVELVYELEAAPGFSNLTASSSNDTKTQAWVRDGKLYVIVTADSSNETITLGGTEAPKNITVHLNGSEKVLTSDKKIAQITGFTDGGIVLKSADGTTGWAVVAKTATVEEGAYYVDGLTCISFTDVPELDIGEGVAANGGKYAITGALGAAGTANTDKFTVDGKWYIKGSSAVVEISVAVTTANDDAAKSDKISLKSNNASVDTNLLTVSGGTSGVATFAQSANTTIKLSIKAGSQKTTDEQVITLAHVHENA